MKEPVVSTEDGMAMGRDPAAVALVIFDRAPIVETSVPMSVFGVGRSASGAPRFNLAVAGEDRPITTTGGLVVSAPHDLVVTIGPDPVMSEATW